MFVELNVTMYEWISFGSGNNLIRQKNTLWKADEILFELGIISNNVAGNTVENHDKPRGNF